MHGQNYIEEECISITPPFNILYYSKSILVRGTLKDYRTYTGTPTCPQ